jgi:hypothetical protein
MLRVHAPLGFFSNLDLQELAKVPSVEVLAVKLLAVGLIIQPTLGLQGDEDYLVRLDRDQIIIRIPEADYIGTWASAPVVKILGRGAWTRGVDESIRQLQVLKMDVASKMVASHLKDAVLSIIDGQIQARRAKA